MAADRGLNVTRLREASGLSRDTINRALKAETPAGMHPDTLGSLARALGITYSQLEASWPHQAASDPGIPVLSDVPAGFADDVPADELVEGYISRGATDIDDPKAFAVRVKGDSMLPDFAPGELCICSPAAWESKGMEDGRVYAIRFTGDRDSGATIKRVYNLPRHKVELRPDNERFPRQVVACEHVALAAKVVAKMTRYE